MLIATAILALLATAAPTHGPAPVVAVRAAPASPTSNPSAEVLTSAQVRADVELAERAYVLIHPGYDRYTKRAALDSAWAELIADARTAGGMTRGRFYLRLQLVLAKIRCDHTKVEIGKAQLAWRTQHPSYLPIRWDVLEGRGVILDSSDPRIPPRSELLSIDGVPLAKLIETYAPLVPVDGFTDPVREAQLGYSSEFQGGVIEHFGAAVESPPARARVTIRVPGDDTPQIVELDRVTLPQWKALTAFRLDFADALEFSRIGEGAAYLAVNSFVNYRNPVRPDRLYDPVFRALRKEGRDTLILDLRQNGGGSTDAQVRLLAHLVDEPVRLARDIRAKTLDFDSVRKHLSSWDKRILNPKRWWFRANDDGTFSARRFLDEALQKIRPDRWAFTGRLIVLSSRDNASATATLLAKLSERHNVTLVGAPTGGSAEGVTANVLLFLRLPESGFLARIPVQRVYNDVTSFEPGMGVRPDLEVIPSADDAFAGRDAVLERAMTLVNEP